MFTQGRVADTALAHHVPPARMPPKPRHILLTLCLLAGSAQAQTTDLPVFELGAPFYAKHFAPHEYGAFPQTWGIAQDSSGLIYVGNYDGILVFDGARWDVVKVPSNTTARSLDVAPDGRVFAGLQGDLGYLDRDSVGSISFTSLRSELSDEVSEFWDVWATHAIGENVYFQTTSQILRWNGSSFGVWTSETGFHTSFKVDETLYVREKEVGLLRLDGEVFTPVPHGDLFADKPVFVLDRLDRDRLVVGTQRDGLFLLESDAVRPFQTEADAFLRDHRLYHGLTVEDRYLALGFLDGGGLLLLDETGRILEHHRESSGLPDGWVNYVFRDRQGGLWLALNNRGIFRLDPNFGITRYGVEHGIDGVPGDVLRYNRSVYLVASTGLLKLDASESYGSKPQVSRVEGIQVPRSAAVFRDKLIVAGSSGLHVIDDGVAVELAEGSYLASRVSMQFPNRVYVGSKTGVAFLEWDGSTWTLSEEEIALGEAVRRIKEASDGTVWIVTRTNRVFRATWRDGRFETEEFTDPAFPVDTQTVLEEIDGRVVLVGQTGYHVLAGGSGSRDEHLDMILSWQTATDSLLAFEVMPDGDIWRVYDDRVEISRCEPECVVEAPEVLKYPDWTFPVSIYVDSTGVAWITSGSTLVRYDPAVDIEQSYQAAFPTLVRRITAIDTNELLFGGHREPGGSVDASIVPDLPFAHNALRFDFALPSFNDAEGNEFQFRLEGRDDGWSAWTREASKNYTNLTPGTYRFRLRGRNAQGYVSPESVYVFTILPPWYLSGWAYGVYGLGVVGLMFFARRYRIMALENKRAKKQAEELARERQVNERLQDLNMRLEQANETLRQADRLKDEFLANTSHELRTPLTGILGCTAILRDEVIGDHLEFVDMIDENGQRLLNTLDSLLDLARLRAGLLDLAFDEMDLVSKARAVTQSFAQLAESKGVAVDVEADGELWGWFDDHCIHSVLNHLVGNAVKFTSDGYVRVRLTEDHDRVVIQVEDTGVGIEKEFIPFLFDEFKQESTGLTRSHEGNGLGLAVTARIVDLIGGEIDVKSEKGVGTTFTVHLPLTRQQPPFPDQGDGLPLSAVHIQGADDDAD